MYYEKQEFIFKTDFDHVTGDLSTLASKAEDYLHRLKSPDEFWDKKDKEEQQEKIEEIKKYISGIYTLIDYATNNYR